LSFRDPQNPERLILNFGRVTHPKVAPAGVSGLLDNITEDLASFNEPQVAT